MKTDSQSASRPFCPGVRHPSGTRDQFFFLLEISFRQLRLCYFVAPSLTRGRVCNLLVQLLLGLARAVTLGSKSRRTHGHMLLSHLRLPQPGRPSSRIYIPQEQGTGFPFCHLLRLAGTTLEVSHLQHVDTDHIENTLLWLYPRIGYRFRPLFCCCTRDLRLLPYNGCCFQAHCLETAVILLLISWPLPNNYSNPVPSV
jgi:hypothetical protein